jgi:hypothetical protein
MSEQEEQTSHKFGKLVPPFPVDTCASASCPDPVLTEETEAFLFTDMESGKLIVFCGGCAAYVELHRADRWRLVML